MPNMDKHTAPQQGHQEPSKRKPKRSSKAKQSTPQLDSDVEEERHQLQEPTPPVASSSAYELSTIQPGTAPLEPLVHGTVLCPAVQQALNAVVAANWNIQYTLLAQALQNNTAAMALQILESAAATAPPDMHGLILARVNTAPGTQPPSTAQPRTGSDPEGGLQRQQAQMPRSPKPSSFQISKTLCAFGRYHHTRPEGVTTDSAGRLSLANIMQVWGTQNGLQSEDVVKAIQQHSATDTGPRYITTTLHNDFYIEVRQTAKHKARNSNFDASAAIGAPRPPKRRRFM